jgi:hypothetical protein
MEAYQEQMERITATWETFVTAVQQVAEVFRAFTRDLDLTKRVSQTLMLTLSKDDYELAMRRYANLLNRSRFCRRKVSWRRLNRLQREEAVLAWLYHGS